MSTLVSSKNRPTTQAEGRSSGIIRRIGVALLILLAVIAIFLTALPVVLLFVITSVPSLLAILLTVMDLGLVVALFRLERTPLVVGGVVAGFIVVSILAVWLSQVFAQTPPITDAQGNPMPDSIAVMETVKLGGSDQWITIRGNNVNNPVLLFLAGGPGGSELVMTRRYLGELEKHFVVVNWDQPGAGKSYHAVDISALTPERFISDGYELTQYLQERFQQKKIYLLGESWGTILGIWLVQQHPDMYHAFISAAQMVNTTEDDVMGYEFAIDYLTQQGRIDQAEALRRSGPPPYTGDGMAMRYMTYLNVLNGYMHAHTRGEGINHNLLFDSLGAPEYGLLDKVNWIRGVSDVFTHFYPQLADVEFRTQAAQLEVPVYFIVGRWDVNAMTSLVEEYFDILEAPHKELIWFDGGHPPLWDEPAHFFDVMVNTVLPQTEAR